MSTETTVTSAKAWAPDVSAFAPADVIPEALIMQASTVAGEVEGDAPSVRVAYVSDASATFKAEGDALDEADPGLDEATVHTGKITQLIRLSNEQYRQSGTANQLSDSVSRAVVKKANEAFLTQAAPTSPAVTPPAGLVNITGVEPASGNVDTDLDNLVDLVATLESNGATPSLIVVDPLGWAELRKFKTASGSNQSLLGAGTDDSEQRLLGLPVIVSAAMSTNSGIVIDRSAVVSAVGNVNVATSEHQYFTSDSIALRCTWRIGWNVTEPDRIGTFDIGSK